MSAGSRAKTAAERASIALEMLVRLQGDTGRAFDDCFEMGDADEVVRIGLEKLARSKRYRDAVRRRRAVTVWVEFVETAEALAESRGTILNPELPAPPGCLL